MKREPILPITDENTEYFIKERGYSWSYDKKYLTKVTQESWEPRPTTHRIDFNTVRNLYEYCIVDVYSNRLFIKIITEPRSINIGVTEKGVV